MIVRELHRDAKLLMVSRGIRAFAFSYLNIVFAIYLDRLGYSTVTIGVIFSVAYLSGALLTGVWGYLSDRFGRRRILILLAILTIVSNGIYIFFSGLLFILLAVIIANVGRVAAAAAVRAVDRSILSRKHCWPRSQRRKIAIKSMRSIFALAQSWARSGRSRADYPNIFKKSGIGRRSLPTDRSSV